MVLLGMAASTVLGAVAPATFPRDAGNAPVLPGLGWYALTVAYSFVFGILGGHTAARLARREEMMHAAVLAAVLTVFGVGLVLNPAPGIPASRTLGYLVASVGGILLGGFIRARAQSGDATPAR
jgi:peptidoglycan/LPS O-acetylase OafA/YrhL